MITTVFYILTDAFSLQGIYKKDQGNHSKVREHFLLKSSRPHYVTILSIGKYCNTVSICQQVSTSNHNYNYRVYVCTYVCMFKCTEL